MTHCPCNCHCDCDHKESNKADRNFEVHAGNCGLYGHTRSICCAECKQLPANFTFNDLCFHSPVLASLHKLAKEFQRLTSPEPFCANAVWYSAMKPVMEREVGFIAHSPKLRSREAYDLAYNTLYNALPNCSHREGGCGCL